MAQQAGTVTVFMKDSKTRATGGVLNVLASWKSGAPVVTGVTVLVDTNTATQFKASYSLTLGGTAKADGSNAFQSDLAVNKAVALNQIKVYLTTNGTHPVIVEQPPDTFSYRA